MKKALVLVFLVFCCIGCYWGVYRIRTGWGSHLSSVSTATPHRFFFPVFFNQENPPTAVESIAVEPTTPTILVGQETSIPNIAAEPESVGPDSLNGIPLDKVLVISEPARQHIQRIYKDGQEQGVNAHAFSKVGDSLSEIPLFLAPFDEGRYQLAQFDYLLDTITFFSGSFGRDSRAVGNSMHSWTTFDAFWTWKPDCEKGESPIECEFRLNNPSILLVRLGSNDVGLPGRYREYIQKLIDFSIDHGAIPVLVTKADRIEGSDTNNDILRELVDANEIPLWDYDQIAQTLPGNGLGEDSVHPTLYYTHDYNQAEALQRGQSIENLTALMMLDRLRRIVSQLGH